MKYLVALVCASACAAFAPHAAAQALQFAPQIKFDDGSAESTLQVDVPPVASDWASVFLDDDYAGREICSMLVRATACQPGRTLTVGLYPANLVIDPTGHTPDFSSPLSQTSSALPVRGCDEWKEFVLPPIVLPSSVAVHAVVQWNVPAPDVSLCEDTTGTFSGRSYFGSTGTFFNGTPLTSGNWMIRLTTSQAGTLPFLTINGTTVAFAKSGAVVTFTFWGTASGQTWTLFRGFTPIHTGTTGSYPCSTADQYSVPLTSPPVVATYHAKIVSSGATTNFPVLVLSAFGTTSPWGVGDDGVREQWFRPSGSLPAGSSDMVAVEMPAPPTAKTISTVTIVYRNVGCGPANFDSVSICQPNLALDPTGATPDIASPLTSNSNIPIFPCPTDPSGVLSVLVPPVIISPANGPLFVVVSWVSLDQALWIGADKDGTDNPSFDHRPGIQAYASGFTTNAYNTATIPLHKNLMIRLQ